VTKYYYYWLYSVVFVILVFCYSTPVRRVENIGDDVPLLVDGVQFDAAIVTVRDQYYYYWLYSVVLAL